MNKTITVRNKAITNIDIEEMCRKLSIPLIACCMKDELTSLQVGDYIINLENSNQPGSHWTALLCRRNECVYVDSFGAPPPQQIEDLLKKYYKRIAYNNWIIQDLKSQACGFYAIAVLKYVNSREKKSDKSLLELVNDYINLYDDDTAKNFKILQKVFKQ